MLAASVLCFFIKQHNGNDKDVIDKETFQKIRSLLRTSHDIWLRSSTASNEAQKAVQSLSIILGMQHLGEDEEIASYLADGAADIFAPFNESARWPGYQGKKSASPLDIKANPQLASRRS
jgi:hypothetical protein